MKAKMLRQQTPKEKTLTIIARVQANRLVKDLNYDDESDYDKPMSMVRAETALDRARRIVGILETLANEIAESIPTS